LDSTKYEEILLLINEAKEELILEYESFPNVTLSKLFDKQERFSQLIFNLAIPENGFKMLNDGSRMFLFEKDLKKNILFVKLTDEIIRIEIITQNKKYCYVMHKSVKLIEFIVLANNQSNEVLTQIEIHLLGGNKLLNTKQITKFRFTEKIEVQVFYTNDSLKIRFPIKKGNYHGLTTTYYPNGKIKSKVKYSKGRLVKLIETYYYDGNSLEKGTLKKGTGTRIIYEDNCSNVLKVENYLNGKLTAH
jgi:antitoxin component YwqK of YwqJK toxin-antitoxin module